MKQVLSLSVLGLFSFGTFACNSSNDPADEMPLSTGGQGGDKAGDPGSGGAEPDEPNEMGGAWGEGGEATGGSSPNGGTGGNDSGPQLVPAFVAQGHLGRLVTSCDEGKTWIADQANDVGDGTCWSGDNEIECDHNVGAARGIAYGAGYFFATFGWGTPSTIRRSANGINWETVLSGDDDARFGGIAVQGEVIFAAAKNARLSEDKGATWGEPVPTELMGFNVRRAASAGSYFVMVGDAGDIVLSDDSGESWYAPSSLEPECGGNIQTSGGIAFGGGTLLVLGGNGIACSSADGGLNFQSSDLGSKIGSHLVWSGSDFVAYNSGTAYRSPDGITWTPTPMSPSVPVGALSVSAQGVFVGIDGGWREANWYDKQNFYRSEDGINWQTLAPGTFTGGHPIRNIAFGYVKPSEQCPLP